MNQKAFSNKYCIHFTEKHEGKMTGMQSLSTAVTCNPICKQRQKDSRCICSHCFAKALFERRGKTYGCFEKNFHVLNAGIIPVSEWPVVNAALYRIESFGDVASTTQAINYINFAKANPRTTFAIWSKNLGFYDAAFRRVGKPRNVIMIQSSKYINIQEKPRFQWVDKVFTVYEKAYAAEHNVVINCGARRCLECRRCYTKKTAVYVNEILK